MTHKPNKQHLPPVKSHQEYEAKIKELEDLVSMLQEEIKALVAQLDRATDF
jgi:exonuclease VII small subunit